MTSPPHAAAAGWRPEPTPRWVPAAVIAAHALALWGLLQMAPVRAAVTEAVPLMVSLLNAPQPAPQPQAPLPAPKPLPQPQLRPPPITPPVLALAEPVPSVPPTWVVPAPPEPLPQPAQAASARPTPPAPAPAPAAPKAIATSDMRYAKAPPLVYPRLSQQRREHGTTWLRLIVDAAGLPQDVRVERSSGHERLDAAALTAMRAARFVPHMEGGRAIAWTAVAPLTFEL